MSDLRKLVVIVDAYGPSRYFCSYLKRLGIACVHLLSTVKPLPRLRLTQLEQYDAKLQHFGILEDTIKRINEIVSEFNAELCEVLPGAEPGVLLADKLSHYYRLRSNGLAKSLARRDKATMAEALRSSNIPIPDFLQTDNLDDARKFVRKHPWPIVLKPLDSAGTDGVHFCYSDAQLQEAFRQVMGVPNNMGSVNREVLIQTFLSGPEYMVNSVSYEGGHYITDIWRAEKSMVEGYAQIYDKNFLIPSETDEYRILKKYVEKVLDSLEIKYGPAHSEVIITKDGPKLLEVGSRVSGGVDPEFNQICLGSDQISLTVESYFNSSKFIQRIDQPYSIRKHGLQIFLSSPKEGKVVAINTKQIFSDIPTLVNFELKLQEGDMLRKTFDLSSSIGVVHLAADKTDDLMRDYSRIITRLDSAIKVLPVTNAY